MVDHPHTTREKERDMEQEDYANYFREASYISFMHPYILDALKKKYRSTAKREKIIFIAIHLLHISKWHYPFVDD